MVPANDGLDGRQPKPRALSRRLRRKERVEDSLDQLGGIPVPVSVTRRRT